MASQQSLVRESLARLNASRSDFHQERELIRLGRRQHWPFRVLGVAPVPKRPVFLNNWWLVPVAEDHSEIPARALERVQAIYQAGIRPKAFVVAHEAPPQLPAPIGVHVATRAEFWIHRLGEYSVTAAKVAGTTLAVVVIPLTLAILGVGALAVLGIVSVILTDPCLIAVTENNVWIQIDNWMA